jgi:hypothetical protein
MLVKKGEQDLASNLNKKNIKIMLLENEKTNSQTFLSFGSRPNASAC